MKRLINLRPSPAMVVACVALAVALGGTSVAAIQALPKNSVGTKQIKNGAVTGAKVKAHTLSASRFAAGVIPTMSNYYTKTLADARYLQGTVVVVASGNAAPSDYNTQIVACPAGYQAVGGGVDPDNIKFVDVTSSGPAIGDDWLYTATDGQHVASTGWRVAVYNTDSAAHAFKAAAICAPIG